MQYDVRRSPEGGGPTEGATLKISSSSVSLNVDDVAASSAFLVKHFGFAELWLWTGSPPSPATTPL